MISHHVCAQKLPSSIFHLFMWENTCQCISLINLYYLPSISIKFCSSHSQSFIISLLLLATETTEKSNTLINICSHLISALLQPAIIKTRFIGTAMHKGGFIKWAYNNYIWLLTEMTPFFSYIFPVRFWKRNHWSLFNMNTVRAIQLFSGT